MTITDLRPTDEVLELRARVRAFMEAHVYPNEPVLDREDEESDALVERLRAVAKDAGLWAPHLPPEAGGSNGSFLVYAHLNEEIGRSLWASSSSVARRPMRETGRSCGGSGRMSRRSAGSARSSPERCGLSSR